MTKKLASQLQKGFSLIELMAVTAIFVLLMTASTTLFLNFMISGAKTNINRKLKEESTVALDQIELLVRNAKKITSACSQSGSSTNVLEVEELDGSTTTISVNADDGINKIRANGSNGAMFLTSDYSTISTSGLTFTCYTVPAKKSQYVSISFTLSKAGSGLSDTAVSQTVNGGAVLRNSMLD